MGNFSRDTFDRLKHYVGVRLQQGVPIVDADWNELDDVRRYELHTFLRWFVGDGVPEGNDGFAVFAVAETNDFGIRGGDGTADGAGRVLVDGWEVVNESDLNFTGQVLFDNAALAAEWGVDPVQPLTTPAANRTDLVYLDAWEREVDSTEDPDHLVNPAIGVETAVRLRREWAVRVVEGSTALPPAPPGHVHYALARLERTGGSATIPGGAIGDRRQTGINLATLSTNVGGVRAEVAAARGTQPSLDARLDQALADDGQLRANVVGNTQVPDGGLGEAKIAFAAATGHDHSGGAQGRPIGAGGLADEAVLYDKIKWQVVNSGTLTNIAVGQMRSAIVDEAYDGKVYIPAATRMDTTGLATITMDLGYVKATGTDPDKMRLTLRVTNLEESTAPVSVVWHVYTIAEV